MLLNHVLIFEETLCCRFENNLCGTITLFENTYLKILNVAVVLIMSIFLVACTSSSSDAPKKESPLRPAAIALTNEAWNDFNQICLPPQDNYKVREKIALGLGYEAGRRGDTTWSFKRRDFSLSFGTIFGEARVKFKRCGIRFPLVALDVSSGKIEDYLNENSLSFERKAYKVDGIRFIDYQVNEQPLLRRTVDRAIVIFNQAK